MKALMFDSLGRMIVRGGKPMVGEEGDPCCTCPDDPLPAECDFTYEWMVLIENCGQPDQTVSTFAAPSLISGEPDEVHERNVWILNTNDYDPESNSCMLHYIMVITVGYDPDTQTCDDVVPATPAAGTLPTICPCAA